jgi:putative ABC transport system permease protein
MGMNKGRVVLGLLCEMIIITTLCLVMGLSIGTITAQPVSNVLLQGQVEAAEKGQNGGGYNSKGNSGGAGTSAGSNQIRPGQSDAKPLTEIEVGMDIETVWQIILISLLLAGVSSVVGIAYITRYEPIKILTERA